MNYDLQRIAAACALECERQQVGVYQLGNLILAYDHAIMCAHQHLTTEGDSPKSTPPWLAALMLLAEMIEPAANTLGFRNVSTTLPGGEPTVPRDQIEQRMTLLTESVDRLTPHEYTLELLRIQPFVEGNGRLAFIVYNWLGGTLDEPRGLPPFEI